MILFPDLLFWTYFLIFFIAVFIAFFVPGDLFLRNNNLSIFQRLILGSSLGMILWCWQGYIFGYMNIRWMSYAYLFVLFVLWISYNFSSLKNVKIKSLFRFRINIPILLVEKL